MPKVNNLSSDSALDVHPDRLRRVAIQHLTQLQGAGLMVLPAATGKDFSVNLDSADVPIPVQPTETARTITTSQASHSALQVRESAAPALAPLVAEEASRSIPAAPIPAPVPSMAASGVDTHRTGRHQALSVIQSEVASCTRCESLCEFRTQTVFGVGNPNARLVLVGEAPGEQEDRDGVPFVGAAGQLLDKILAACGLHRDDVYILNALKCRPPQNRTPRPEELSNCWDFGRRQLEVLQPEFICCLGSVAAKTVLDTNQSVGRLRRQFHAYGKSRVLVTYHPAYLLRTTSAKKHAWDDMKMLMQAMGISIPPASR